MPHSPSVRTRQAEHISSVDADVWVFTECHDLVESGKKFRHASEGGRDHDEDLRARWVTVSTDYWINPLPVRDPVRSAAVRVFPPGEPPFVVFGTVLPWLGSNWKGHLASDGAAFPAALRIQREDWIDLLSAYPNDEMILAGDFNQDLAPRHCYGSSQNRELLKRTLAEVGLVALTSGEEDPVWRDSRPRGCIDHICLRSDSMWRPVQLERWPDLPVPDRKISDHFGVWVELGKRSDSGAA